LRGVFQSPGRKKGKKEVDREEEGTDAVYLFFSLKPWTPWTLKIEVYD